MIRKILSYLIPIPIFKTKSYWSNSIEVTWANGELVLDSENTNYSYGSLQRILRLGLKKNWLSANSFYEQNPSFRCCRR
jgi:hypothetical protein